MKNTKGILWSYGISGDLPIVLIVIKKYEDLDVIYDMIKAHEYWRTKGILADLVILSYEEISYNHPLWNSIFDIVSGSHLGNLQNVPGGVFMLRGEILDKQDIEELIDIANIVAKDGEINLPQDILIEETFNDGLMKKDGKSIDKRELSFFNGIGGFDEKSMEYVIYPTSNDYTPLPWSNVMCNKDFGCIMTEAGGGYTWAFNSREYRLTPWSNDPVTDIQGEYIYLEDLESNERFSAYLLPYETNGGYEVSFGLGYCKYLAIISDLLIEFTIFVPCKDLVKVSMIKIKNLSGRKRNLNLHYYINPVLAFSNNFREKNIKTTVENDKIIFENKYEKEFYNNKVYLTTGVNSNFCKKNVGMESYVNVEIDNNDEVKKVFLLGIYQDESIISKFLDYEKSQEELYKVKDFYKKDIQRIKVSTPDKATNLLLNGFLLYQALVCRIFGKSSFYQSGGATGFRDQLQDSMPFAFIMPEITREQILYHARHQFGEGDVLHWWHKEAQKGTRTRFSDDLLWLVYVTNYYIKVTGDTGILDEQIPFVEGMELEEFEDEKYIEFEYSKNSASLFAHCIFSIEHSLKFGEHGLLLMGSGDWNDGMNEVGNKGKGESVWLSWFLIKVLVDFEPICRTQGRDDLADKYLEIAKNLGREVNSNAWDGEWYKRAFFDDGTPLGSRENDECKIDSISQSWSVISGAGDENKKEKAMNSVDNYLIDKENGIIKLLTPPFSKGELNPGYIKSYLEGIRENGGQYTHAAIWTGIAYAIMRKGDKAFSVFEMLNPINHSRTDSEMKKYKLEPYVISADIYTNPLQVGRGGWSWYTGAAAWMYRFGIEYILGIKFCGDVITIEPATSSKWEEYTLEYRFNNTTYKINVKLSSKKGKKIIIDNVLEDGNSFKINDDGNFHFIEVYVSD